MNGDNERKKKIIVAVNASSPANPESVYRDAKRARRDASLSALKKERDALKQKIGEDPLSTPTFQATLKAVEELISQKET